MSWLARQISATTSRRTCSSTTRHPHKYWDAVSGFGACALWAHWMNPPSHPPPHLPPWGMGSSILRRFHLLFPWLRPWLRLQTLWAHSTACDRTGNSRGWRFVTILTCHRSTLSCRPPVLRVCSSHQRSNLLSGCTVTLAIPIVRSTQPQRNLASTARTRSRTTSELQSTSGPLRPRGYGHATVR